MKTKTPKVKAPQEVVKFNGKEKDKIERYNWSPLKDKPGKFMLIPKFTINVDHGYQRPENRKPREIAASFSWLAFGVLLVAHREDGTFWVFDGQHRLLAAQKRSDISHVPCMVYKVGGVADEAGGFVDANTLRKNVPYVYKHIANMRRGDEAAMALSNLLGRYGYTPITGRKEGPHIACLSILARHIKADAAAVERVFPVVVDAVSGGFIPERVLGGFVYLERFGSETLSTKRWRDRARKISPVEFEQATTLAAAALVRGGDKRFAEGILELLNKGIRQSERLYLNPPSGKKG